MKIKKMYIEDVIKECEKLGFQVDYNDNSGIYFVPKMDFYIKAWNGKIEIGTDYSNDDLINFLKLYKEVQYYIELDDENNENK